MNGFGKFTMLVIISISGVQKATTGREFKQIEFAEKIFIQLPGQSAQEQLTNKPSRKRNVWNAFKDERPGMNNAEFAADPLFASAKLNLSVAGSIETVHTTEYTITRPDGTKGRPAYKLSGVIFEGEDALSIFNKQLARNGACVVNAETGEQTAPEQVGKVLEPKGEIAMAEEVLEEGAAK